MDWSWLSDLFTGVVHLFDPLKGIKHWTIWTEIWKVYLKLKKWRDWYRDHVQKEIKAMQDMQRRIYNLVFKPILTIVDTIRRITGVVGIFNRGLATRLNTMFLRVEGYILEPFNALTSKFNSFERIFDAFLTPLGFFDRATLLNSIWRDFGLLRNLFRNPFGATMPPGAGATPPVFGDQVIWVSDYLQGQSSPIQPSVDASLQDFFAFIGVQGS